jgi:hypothetical protein
MLADGPLAWLRSLLGRTEAPKPDAGSERAVKLPAEELELEEPDADPGSETE